MGSETPLVSNVNESIVNDYFVITNKHRTVNGNREFDNSLIFIEFTQATNAKQ